MTGARDATHVPEEVRGGLGALPCDSKDREAQSLHLSVPSEKTFQRVHSAGNSTAVKMQSKSHGAGRGHPATTPRCAAGGTMRSVTSAQGIPARLWKAGLASGALRSMLCAAGRRMLTQVSGCGSGPARAPGAWRPAGPRVSSTQTGGWTFSAKGTRLLGPSQIPGGRALNSVLHHRRFLLGRLSQDPEVTPRSARAACLRRFRCRAGYRRGRSAGLFGSLHLIFSL